MIDDRVERGLGKYTLINRAFLSVSVVVFFLSLVQDTCQVLMSRYGSESHARVSVKNNSDSCQTPISITGYFSDWVT